jgi:hypothetical protein
LELIDPGSVIWGGSYEKNTGNASSGAAALTPTARGVAAGKQVAS